MKLVVFGRDTCAECPAAKKYLKYKNIDYEYRDAEGQEYLSLTGLFGVHVPLILDMETGKGVVGYNPGEIMKLVS